MSRQVSRLSARRSFVPFLAVLALDMVIAGVALGFVGFHHRVGPAPRAGAVAADRRVAPSPVPAPRSASPAVRPSGASSPTLLVRGARVVEGVEVGFPHTAVGAVSAAVEDFVALASAGTSDRAGVIAPLVLDQAAPTSAAGTAVPSPTGGGEAAGAGAESAVTIPWMYQLRDEGPDQLNVILLSTVADPANPAAPTLVTVTPLEMRWNPTVADWRIGSIDASDEAALRAAPDTPAAAAKGWIPLRR